MILDHLRCDTGSPKSKLPRSWIKVNRVHHLASLVDVWAELGVILDHLILSVRCDTGSPEFVSKV